MPFARLDDSTIQLAPSSPLSSGAISHSPGTLYLAGVHQYRQSSTDPVVPTVSGLDVDGDWEQIHDSLWTDTGTTRRRFTLFAGRSRSRGSGTVDVAFASAPAVMCTQVIAVPGGDDIVQIQSASVAAASGLNEDITMSAPASASSVFVTFVAANVNVSATARLELDADVGGEADWITFDVEANAGAPVATFLSGYLPRDPSSDLTPGWYQTTSTPATHFVTVEVGHLAPSNIPLRGPSSSGDIYLSDVVPTLHGVHVYVGGSWVEKPILRHNGTGWVQVDFSDL